MSYSYRLRVFASFVSVPLVAEISVALRAHSGYETQPVDITHLTKSEEASWKRVGGMD